MIFSSRITVLLLIRHSAVRLNYQQGKWKLYELHQSVVSLAPGIYVEHLGSRCSAEPPGIKSSPEEKTPRIFSASRLMTLHHVG